MKYAIRYLNLAMLLTLLVGCGSPLQVATKTLAAVGAAEDAAIKSAAMGMAQGKISPVQWDNINGKHALFLVSYDTACDAVKGDLNHFSPVDVTALANDVINLVNQLKL